MRRNKLILSVMILVLFIPFNSKSNFTSAYHAGTNGCGNSAHDIIFLEALESLEYSGYNDLAFEASNYEYIICKGLNDVDEFGDAHSTFDSWHFWYGGDIERNGAGLATIQNYELAIQRINVNKYNAYYYLGRTLHFIQDLTVPQHANNQPISSSNYHSEYESLVEDKLDTIKTYGDAIDPIFESYLAPLYYRSYNHHKSIFLYLKHAASIAQDKAYLVDDYGDFHDNNGAHAEAAISQLLPLAIQLTAGAIEKFHRDSRLIHYYTFDNDFKDYFWFHEPVDGTVKGNVINSPTGKYGQAAYFDGTNDYISFGNQFYTLENYNQISLSMWIKPETLNRNYQKIFNKGENGLFISLDDYGKIRGGVSGSYATTSNNVITSTFRFYHIVMTWDGSTNEAKIYVNNLLKASYTGVNSEIGAGNSNLGTWYNGYYDYYGYLDDFRIYNQILSPEDIDFIYHYPLGFARSGY
ncbi:MAG: hypothetical protein INQ03_16810 [Candidatus Heimdallarchaeota archaeon]|nr:hypothetical protein [Candidatus Heimdallarchaeota archaeon]